MSIPVSSWFLIQSVQEDNQSGQKSSQDGKLLCQSVFLPQQTPLQSVFMAHE